MNTSGADYSQDQTALHFTPEQKAERENFVRLLRQDLDCQEGEAIRVGIARLKQELEQAKSALEACQPWTPQLLKQYVTDTSDGFECLPACDSHGHEDLCPVTNVVQAFRLLRERLEQAKERERQLGEHVFGGASMWERIQDLESANAQLTDLLREVLASAVPNPKEHPTMWAAWKKAEAALTVPPKKEKL